MLGAGGAFFATFRFAAFFAGAFLAAFLATFFAPFFALDAFFGADFLVLFFFADFFFAIGVAPLASKHNEAACKVPLSIQPG
jgi:hypothetical protein